MKNTYTKLYNANFSFFTLNTKKTTHCLYNFTRQYHSSKFHLHLRKLYATNHGRKLPLKPFEEKPLASFQDCSKTKNLTLFKDFFGKGGIYKFTLISKPHIFYIGSTANFFLRF